MNWKNTKYYLFIILILLYLFIPLLATFIYSISTKWQSTIIPEGITFQWYIQLFNDFRFLEAMARSFILTTLSLSISAIIMIPTVFIVIVYFPKLEKFLKVLVMLPFAMPGVVAAVGLLKLYSSEPLPISGTIWILLGAYFVIALPYMYQGISNSLRTINVKDLMEAAEMLNATKIQAFIYIILPNIFKGIMVSMLLTFSILFGEFVLANILAGGNFETVQVYLYNKKNESGHFTSAIVITYFIFILILSGVIVKINKLINKADA